MSRRAALAFLVSAAASALIWALSPLLTGHAEPWDAGWLFYPGPLVLLGAFFLLGYSAIFLLAAALAYLRSKAATSQ